MMTPPFLCLCLFLAAFCPSISSKKPHIVFILADDLGWNDIGFHNASDIDSPHIDELARTGLMLDNYYIQHICSPTRSALMSGRYPIHTGLQHGVIRPTSPYGLPLQETIIPQEMLRAGYSTHMVGKWHLGFCNASFVPTSRGFDSFLGYYLGAEDYFQHTRSYNGVSGYDLRNGTTKIRADNVYSANLFEQEFERVVLHRGTKPMFIYMPYQSVHEPLQAPAADIKPYDKKIPDKKRRTKAGMVTALDKEIGKMVALLKSEGLWENTLLIFSTDNGGPVDSAANNYPLRGSKATLWEGGVRGAGFVNGGFLNSNRRGKISTELMHITDWLPTFCEIGGVNPSHPQRLDGVSQWKMIQQGSNSSRFLILHNIDPLGCTLPVCGAVRYHEWKLVVGHEVEEKNDRGFWNPLTDINENNPTVKCGGPAPARNMTGCPFNGKPCLFNIESDPCEYKDVYAENTKVGGELMQILLSFNNTMIPPWNGFIPPDANGADPKKHGGYWSPWHQGACFKQM